MSDFLLQWESPQLDYYWCHHLIHEVYAKNLVKARLGDQERDWIASCDASGFSFHISQGEIQRLAPVARAFYTDRTRLENYFRDIEILSRHVDTLPWHPAPGEDPLDALDRIEPLFHEAIGLHLCSQPHLTQVVEQELTLALDAIGMQGDERHQAMDWLLRPRRLPLVLQERLDWYEQVLCVPPDHTDQRLIDHLDTWRYLTAGDSKQPTTEAELRARLTADRRCLDQTAEQARRLREIADGDLPPVPTALHSAGAALDWAERARGLAYYRFMTKQTWLKLWYLMEQHREVLGPEAAGLITQEARETSGEDHDRSAYVLLSTDGFVELFYNGTDTAVRGHHLTPLEPLGDRPLTGSTGYPGLVEGTVVVIDWSDSLETKRHLVGEETILVVPQTTPDFVPLLNQCTGLVADEGGLTGHASIIAREMRLPTLIGSRVGTRLLRDGDRIVLNASEGWVRRTPPHSMEAV
ncbi:PEP-utilizing enzyme [Streptomyces sp. NPDC007907]|uniref:PEP-utilizing enzyme n=1 Tax=Streptomyces sp. NPDC007907 TaxID=3364789 RepID=UPI0036EE8862